MYKVVLLTKHSKDVADICSKIKPDNIIFEMRHIKEDSEDKMIQVVKDAEVIMLHGEIPDKVLANADKLILLQLLSAGEDHLNMPLIREKGIQVKNLSGVNAQSVAEMTIALILTIYRRLCILDKELRNGNWYNHELMSLNKMYELSKKTVGIIGLGNIGLKVARLLNGFDCNIIGYDVCPIQEDEELLNIKRVDLKKLLMLSDVISLHVSLNPYTKYLIDKDELSIMKNKSIIVNVSRGAIINEKALAQALKEGRIAGAGLDVFEKEPLDNNNPLLLLDNVVLTPHCAGKTFESWHRRIEAAFKNIIEFMES